jgi:hypothetical protein
MATLIEVGVFISGILRAWTPWIVRRLIALAVKRLPENQRSRYAEEWPAYVVEMPGEIAKLLAALGFLLAAPRMRSQQVQGRALEEHEELGTITLEAVNEGQRRLTIRAKIPPRSTVCVDLKTGKIYRVPDE